MKNHLIKMSKYNLWASQQLVDLLKPLVANGDFSKDIGMFFLSIHGTINHLALGDDVWITRIQGKSKSESRLGDWSHLWTLSGKDLIAVQQAFDVETALNNYLKGVEEWVKIIEDHTEEQLMGNLKYADHKGTKFEAPLINVISHILNHGTHHRGQITDGMSRLGYPTGKLDLLYSPQMDRHQSETQ